ncbi:MAG: hypothetical protein WCY93_12075 [Anaerolineaceae bacterium]
MLHAIDTRGWNLESAWCVPSAISFLTGAPLIHTHSRAAFLQNISLKDVEGIYMGDAILLLREQGYKVERIKLTDRYSAPPTLAKFLEDRTPYEKMMPMMICVETTKDAHMVTAHYGFAADNHTMKPVPIKNFPHLRKKVTDAVIVSQAK